MTLAVRNKVCGLCQGFPLAEWALVGHCGEMVHSTQELVKLTETVLLNTFNALLVVVL